MKKKQKTDEAAAFFAAARELAAKDKKPLVFVDLSSLPLSATFSLRLNFRPSPDAMTPASLSVLAKVRKQDGTFQDDVLFYVQQPAHKKK